MEHVGAETGGSVVTLRNTLLVLELGHIALGQAFTIKDALFEIPCGSAEDSSLITSRPESSKLHTGIGIVNG
jgi:hypothetical protein